VSPSCSPSCPRRKVKKSPKIAKKYPQNGGGGRHIQEYIWSTFGGALRSREKNQICKSDFCQISLKTCSNSMSNFVQKNRVGALFLLGTGSVPLLLPVLPPAQSQKIAQNRKKVPSKWLTTRRYNCRRKKCNFFSLPTSPPLLFDHIFFTFRPPDLQRTVFFR
jgi:hypothetical protein